MTTSPFAPTTWTSNKSCGRSVSRIREKRGVDYTEEEIRELAGVKLETVSRSARRPLGSARSVPALEAPRCRAPQNFAFEEARSTRPTAAHPLHPASCSTRPEAVLQSESDHPGAAHSVGAQHAQQARGARCAALRGHAQPRARADAAGHRGQEPQDARRVDVEPARLRRAAGARARGRRHVPARRGAAAAAAGGAEAAAAARSGSGRAPRHAGDAAAAPRAPAAPGRSWRGASRRQAAREGAGQRPSDRRARATRTAAPRPSPPRRPPRRRASTES